MPQTFMPGQFVITKNNKYPEATIRWVDYFMDGAEGSILFTKGVEGNGYDIDENGFYDSTNYNKKETGKQYTFGGSYPVYYQALSLYKLGIRNQEAEDHYLAMLDELYPTRPNSVWGEFSWTDEEAEEMKILQTDIHGYIEEIKAKLITGEMSFDQWDEIQTNIKNMGLDRYIEIYTQAALRIENAG